MILKKTVLLAIVLFQMILVFHLLLKVKNLLNIQTYEVNDQYITRISKQEVSIATNSSNFKNYYELIPGSTVKFNPDWLGVQAIHTVNADGLHDRFDYEFEKERDTFRIITVGDSFTYGSYIDTKDNYTELLENKLRNEKPCKNFSKYEVINTGMHGFDVEFTIERLLTKGLTYKPDLVIWLLHAWNLDRVNEITIGLQKKKQYDSYDKLKNDTYSVLKEKYNTDIMSYQKKVLDRLSNSYKGKLLIVTFKDFREDEKALELVKYLLDKNPGYAFFDSLLEYWQDDSIRLPDDHPNKKGHIKIAEKLYEYLMSNLKYVCS